ncbi:hypothetical protein TDB9533_02857 [Thalassocella blandensis]|nr:hypothetical protein TDB9533_02857 [Thalassocella blandensis]
MQLTKPLQRIIAFSRPLFLCAFCLVFLTSCSSTKLAYNVLDVVIQWQIGKYVSLNKEQKAQSKQAIDEFHQWHRATQLPRYSAYINAFLGRLQEQPFTGESVHAETDEVQLLLDTSMEKFLPILTNLVMSFDDEQCQEVLETLAEKREEYKKDYVDISSEKQIENRKTDLVDELGFFFGRFSKQQKQLIDDWARQMLPFEAHTVKQYDLWGKLLQDAFATRNNREELTDKLRVIVLYRTDDWDPELEAILDKNQEITYQLIADLINTQSDKQRKKFVRKLEGFEQDFNQLTQG